MRSHAFGVRRIIHYIEPFQELKMASDTGAEEEVEAVIDRVMRRALTSYGTRAE